MHTSIVVIENVTPLLCKMAWSMGYRPIWPNTNYYDDESDDDAENAEDITFYHPDGSTEGKSKSWCISNGFFEIEPGLWSGEWYWRDSPHAKKELEEQKRQQAAEAEKKRKSGQLAGVDCLAEDKRRRREELPDELHGQDGPHPGAAGADLRQLEKEDDSKFECPIGGCTRKFPSQVQLDNHVQNQTGKAHTRHRRQHNLKNQAGRGHDRHHQKDSLPLQNQTGTSRDRYRRKPKLEELLALDRIRERLEDIEKAEMKPLVEDQFNQGAQGLLRDDKYLLEDTIVEELLEGPSELQAHWVDAVVQARNRAKAWDLTQYRKEGELLRNWLIHKEEQDPVSGKKKNKSWIAAGKENNFSVAVDAQQKMFLSKTKISNGGLAIRDDEPLYDSSSSEEDRVTPSKRQLKRLSLKSSSKTKKASASTQRKIHHECYQCMIALNPKDDDQYVRCGSCDGCYCEDCAECVACGQHNCDCFKDRKSSCREFDGWDENEEQFYNHVVCPKCDQFYCLECLDSGYHDGQQVVSTCYSCHEHSCESCGLVRCASCDECYCEGCAECVACGQHNCDCVARRKALRNEFDYRDEDQEEKYFNHIVCPKCDQFYCLECLDGEGYRFDNVISTCHVCQETHSCKSCGFLDQCDCGGCDGMYTCDKCFDPRFLEKKEKVCLKCVEAMRDEYLCYGDY